MRTDLPNELIEAQESNQGEISIVADGYWFEDGPADLLGTFNVLKYKLTNFRLELTIETPPALPATLRGIEAINLNPGVAREQRALAANYIAEFRAAVINRGSKIVRSYPTFTEPSGF